MRLADELIRTEAFERPKDLMRCGWEVRADNRQAAKFLVDVMRVGDSLRQSFKEAAGRVQVWVGPMKLSSVTSSAEVGGGCCRLGQQACLALKYRSAIVHPIPCSVSNQSCWNLCPLRCWL